MHEWLVVCVFTVNINSLFSFRCSLLSFIYLDRIRRYVVVKIYRFFVSVKKLSAWKAAEKLSLAEFYEYIRHKYCHFYVDQIQNQRQQKRVFLPIPDGVGFTKILIGDSVTKRQNIKTRSLVKTFIKIDLKIYIQAYASREKTSKEWKIFIFHEHTNIYSKHIQLFSSFDRESKLIQS